MEMSDDGESEGVLVRKWSPGAGGVVSQWVRI